MNKTDIDEIVLKLNYLNQTKGLIKEAIKEQGIKITDADTFRSYVDKINEIKPEVIKPVVPNDPYNFQEKQLCFCILHREHSGTVTKEIHPFNDKDLSFLEALDFSNLSSLERFFENATFKKST